MSDAKEEYTKSVAQLKKSAVRWTAASYILLFFNVVLAAFSAWRHEPILMVFNSVFIFLQAELLRRRAKLVIEHEIIQKFLDSVEIKIKVITGDPNIQIRVDEPEVETVH